MNPIVGTSTKMNLTSSELSDYLDRLMLAVSEVAGVELFVLPPFTALWIARERLAGTGIAWGAQDVHPDDAGAHTGDVSAKMLADLGCRYVECGHSERRRDHDGDGEPPQEPPEATVGRARAHSGSPRPATARRPAR